MDNQNFQNHKKFRILTPNQYIIYGSILCLNILAIGNLIHALMTNSGKVYSLLFFLTGFALLSVYFFMRFLTIKLQDRIIRTEENLRHFVLAGKLLDKNLKINQIIALRFAPDGEFIGLAERAVKENLSSSDIKKAIHDWRADNSRI
jgi:hypothetical protein